MPGIGGGVISEKRKRFEQAKAQPRKDILVHLESNLSQRCCQPGKAKIFMCFTCDPCPSAALVSSITIPAIQLCHKYGFGVRLLTKNGDHAQTAIEELTPADEYGVTLTCIDPVDSLAWSRARHGRAVA